MRRTQLFCAFGVIVWSAAVACSQPADSVVLPEALRAHLKAERFQIVSALRGLPIGVRNGLQKLFGTLSLDIVEPGAPFQVPGAAIDPQLKIRRLVVAGCSTDHCLVYYERGGVTHTWHLALFHWTPAETRFEAGGTVPRDLVSVDDLLHVTLSGGIKTPKVW